MQKILYAILIVALIIVIGLLLSITAINLYSFIMVLKGGSVAEKSIVDYVTIMLACIALCFTISIVIPYFLSNQIIKKEIEKTVNDIFNRDYKIDLNNALNTLERGDADHSRMTAIFLLKHKQYIWSIGWICRSILRYLRCDNIPQEKMYRDIIQMCIPVLIQDITLLITDIKRKESIGLRKAILERFNSENLEGKNKLIIRTLTDIIDYRTLSSSKMSKIQVTETPVQKRIIDLFIELITIILTPEELRKCSEMSWYESSQFSKNISPNSSTLENVFQELHTVVVSLK